MVFLKKHLFKLILLGLLIAKLATAQEPVSFLFGGVIALLAVSALVTVHELGHAIFMRWRGIGVDIFSIGFGNTLFTWYWGEIEFRISECPAGGYVLPLSKEQFTLGNGSVQAADPDRRSKSARGTKARRAMLQNSSRYLENSSPADRIWGYLGGPIFSLLLGVLLGCGTTVFCGVPSNLLESSAYDVSSHAPMVRPVDVIDVAPIKEGALPAYLNGRVALVPVDFVPAIIHALKINLFVFVLGILLPLLLFKELFIVLNISVFKTPAGALGIMSLLSAISMQNMPMLLISVGAFSSLVAGFNMFPGMLGWREGFGLLDGGKICIELSELCFGKGFKPMLFCARILTPVTALLLVLMLWDFVLVSFFTLAEFFLAISAQ